MYSIYGIHLLIFFFLSLIAFSASFQSLYWPFPALRKQQKMQQITQMHSQKKTHTYTLNIVSKCDWMQLWSLWVAAVRKKRQPPWRDLQPNWKIVSRFLSVVHSRRNKAENICAINTIYTDPPSLSGEVSFNNDSTFIFTLQWPLCVCTALGGSYHLSIFLCGFI